KTRRSSVRGKLTAPEHCWKPAENFREPEAKGKFFRWQPHSLENCWNGPLSFIRQMRRKGWDRWKFFREKMESDGPEKIFSRNGKLPSGFFGTISMRARRLIPFPRRDVCIW